MKFIAITKGITNLPFGDWIKKMKLSRKYVIDKESTIDNIYPFIMNLGLTINYLIWWGQNCGFFIYGLFLGESHFLFPSLYFSNA